LEEGQRTGGGIFGEKSFQRNGKQETSSAAFRKKQSGTDGFCFSVLAKRANSEMRAKKFSERAALWRKRERLLFLERWRRGQHLQRSAVVRRVALECGNCRVQRMENVP